MEILPSILSLATLITGIILTISNLSSSDSPIIKEVSIDVDFRDVNIAIDPSFALTDDTAKNSFTNSFYKVGLHYKWCGRDYLDADKHRNILEYLFMYCWDRHLLCWEAV